MSREQLLAEILRLPEEERRDLLDEAMESLSSDGSNGLAMTPELRAELERRLADMNANPEDETSWEEVCAEIDRRTKQA